jgi:outer membrane immunogenic protein
MKRLLTTGAALAALIGTPALAADMALKAPPPPPAPVWSWTGFYVGGNAGWVGERTSGTSDFVDTAFAPGNAEFSNPQSNAFSPSGFIGGFQAGYNWQTTKNFVLGVEGDFDWTRTSYSFCRQTDILFSVACVDAPPTNIDGFENIAGQTDWIATARARAGVTWDRFFFYGTGGAAWGNIKTTESLSCATDGCGGTSTLKLVASSTTTQTKEGWAAGLGAEGMLLPNWSLKAEWLYVDLGHLTNTFSTVGNAGGTESVVWSRSEHYNIVRVGLNYHFGGPFVTK